MFEGSSAVSCGTNCAIKGVEVSSNASDGGVSCVPSDWPYRLSSRQWAMGCGRSVGVSNKEARYRKKYAVRGSSQMGFYKVRSRAGHESVCAVVYAAYGVRGADESDGVR